MNKELIILIGNIGSGKSTLTKQYQEKGYVVIARDWLRKAIGGGEYVFNKQYEPVIFSTEEYLYKKFIRLGKSIIVDEVGITKSLRKRYIEFAELHNYNIKGIILPIISKEESVKRRLQDNHGNTDKETWEQVWEQFNEAYEEPTKDEGFKEIIKL